MWMTLMIHLFLLPFCYLKIVRQSDNPGMVWWLLFTGNLQTIDKSPELVSKNLLLRLGHLDKANN